MTVQFTFWYSHILLVFLKPACEQDVAKLDLFFVYVKGMSFGR